MFAIVCVCACNTHTLTTQHLCRQRDTSVWVITRTHAHAHAHTTHMGAGASRVAPDPQPRRKANRQELESEINAMKKKMKRLLASVQRIQLREGCVGNSECTVCMQSPINAIFLPCAHACACCACVDTMIRKGSTRCPMCRESIESVSRIYLPSCESTAQRTPPPPIGIGDQPRIDFAQTWTAAATVRA